MDLSLLIRNYVGGRTQSDVHPERNALLGFAPANKMAQPSRLSGESQLVTVKTGLTRLIATHKRMPVSNLDLVNHRFTVDFVGSGVGQK